MMKLFKNKNTLLTLGALGGIIFIFCVVQIHSLDKAHSTFENYYNFRGCAQLLNKSEDSGTCRTKSGDVIKIVKFNNKWYLDGDLPGKW